MNDNFEHLKENIIDEANLRESLSFAAFYIALFENFTNSIEDQIKKLYWRGSEIGDDGEYKDKYHSDYKTRIEKRDVDGKGNHDVLKASMLWLKDEGAIDDEDYEFFLEAKKQRNIFSHELISVVFRGITEEEIKRFFDLFSLYKKIDQWWIVEIDIPALGDYVPVNVDKNEVSSVITQLFAMMIDVLYRGQSDNLKLLMDQQIGEH